MGLEDTLGVCVT